MTTNHKLGKAINIWADRSHQWWFGYLLKSNNAPSDDMQEQIKGRGGIGIQVSKQEVRERNFAGIMRIIKNSITVHKNISKYISNRVNHRKQVFM